jgi:hypothetical protein
MGAQSPSTLVSLADLQAFGASLVQQFRDLVPAPPSPLNQGMFGSLAGCRDKPIHTHADRRSPTPPQTPRRPRMATHTPSSAKQSTPSSSRHTLLSPLSRKGQGQPTSPRIPKTTSLDDALRYWEKGDEELGLTVPLKTWATVYQPSEYRSEAQKLSMIRILRDEFVDHCDRDWSVFEESYPGLRHQYTKLVNAVRQARVARGDAKPRRAHRP